MSEPRELTKIEVRDRLLDYICQMIDYWDRLTPTRPYTQRDRLAGLAFSLLVALDGEAAALPGFLVVPASHVTDRDYQRSNGDNWYPPVPDEIDPALLCDIGGALHELFHERDPQRAKTMGEREVGRL